MADDSGICHQTSAVAVRVPGDDGRIEPFERRAECLALAEDRRPRQAGLEGLERESLEQLRIVVDGPPPFLVVVGHHQWVRARTFCARPEAARFRADRHSTATITRIR